ncbi:D-xylulose reductase XYL2 TDEL_0C00390 [Torulaspora delbrueckii]|uniref:Enoyl reductase (ER) domain-containing protein n=1 Tax=Torulaspora delbrueckii TaxID=4950 RepID=G8ZQY6_TORDE|nr:hypothetical protein TDEL_0C00390 [Torulaspora delbrueckii]CCE90928.1 hypothetical protein TDEL_0C00390 [Torulaspora delbrueckii]
MASQEAVVLEKKELIQIESRPIPEIKNPHDVKIQIKATGICGSDVHYFTQGSIGDFVVKSPLVLGHESAGVVVEVGDAVSSVKVGDRVAVEPGVPSRYSKETMSGHYNLCPHMAFAATPPYDGTLVKYYLSPEDFVYKLADHISFEEGAVVEPLSVAVHANRLANTAFGQAVLVLGAGPVGLLAGAVAKAFGATDVVFVDIFESKLEKAKQFGATRTVLFKPDSDENDLVSLVTKSLGGLHPDVVFECSGAEKCIRAAVKSVKRGGTFVQVGMGKDNINFPINEFSQKEATFKGCFRYYEGDFDDAVKLLSTGKVNVKPLITKVFPFEQAVEAYKHNVEHAKDVTKTIITGPQ